MGEAFVPRPIPTPSTTSEGSDGNTQAYFLFLRVARLVVTPMNFRELMLL